MKNWIVAFGTEKFYLTEEEAKYYMQALAQGKKFILLKSGRMLSDKALYIVPTDTFKETEMLEAGKWQCAYGNWHTKGFPCYCKKALPE